MPGISLEEFKGALIDVCRPNRFFASIDHPDWQEEWGYLVKACSLPSRTSGEVALNWQGMQYKLPADHTFDDFTITFLNDIECNVKNFIESLFETQHNMATSVRGLPAECKFTVTVQQLNGAGEFVRQYKLYFCHPKQMDAIELDYDTTDSIETLNVTFSYSYFEVEGIEAAAKTEGNPEAPISKEPSQMVEPDMTGYLSYKPKKTPKPSLTW